ncbi:hypothetical protein LCGC14_2186240 [marine sediment metagenome]|uniref:Uncharacterized protein n=1 Tax=marine sediment metagenome TaxID=412755 RepID=A0A0F9FYB5_9ZZZZ
MILYVISLIVLFVLFGALKQTEQPTRLRGAVSESAINTFTATEISVPRILDSRLLFDADSIKIVAVRPVRTTVGVASTQCQLMLSDDEPTSLLLFDDPKLIAELELESVFALLESAAGVFTVQKLAPSAIIGNRDGLVDSTRWRNVLPDDKVWLVVESTDVTNVIIARVIILGKLDKLDTDDFNALILSRL